MTRRRKEIAISGREGWNLRLICRCMADFMVIQVLCVVLMLFFPAIAMWFPDWLQVRGDAERRWIQIEYVVPPVVTAAAVRWN